MSVNEENYKFELFILTYSENFAENDHNPYGSPFDMNKNAENNSALMSKHMRVIHTVTNNERYLANMRTKLDKQYTEVISVLLLQPVCPDAP